MADRLGDRRKDASTRTPGARRRERRRGRAVTRDLGLPDAAPQVNPNAGAIALGHPLGASGARLVTTALCELERIGGRYALITLCIGVGQGIALVIERM
ncbi:MAG: thiolase [Burkholderiales bacterium]|nr:thiolase [Burkholderiales bacterium]